MPKAERRTAILASVLAASIIASASVAQHRQPVPVSAEVFVNSALERYLRVSQLAGTTFPYPWVVRGLSPSEVEAISPADSMHPWAGRFRFAPDTARGSRLMWVRPQAQVIYNSVIPYGSNDGPIWAGRGITTALQAGFAVRYGPVSLTLAPVAFRAENEAFDLVATGLEGEERFRDSYSPSNIDLPQRFGDGAYTWVDPGESLLRIELAGAAAGISTASQHWGPAAEFPLILGNNAGGFPHLFVGTSRPANVVLGSVHGRIIWGQPAQSEFSPISEEEGRRVATGLVVSFSPGGVTGLEVGLARMFHILEDKGAARGDLLLRPFDVFLKERANVDLDQRRENQLASVFARWAFPASGFELYGEFAREDHSWDLRDFILEPDHISGFTVGFNRVWKFAEGSWLSLRGEVVNASVSHLQEVRGQSRLYWHGRVRQGHTHRGQLLGSPEAYLGVGSVLGMDYYVPQGRWTVEWRRQGEPNGRTLQTLGAGWHRFHGAWEISAHLAGVYIVRAEGEAFNLHATVGARTAVPWAR